MIRHIGFVRKKIARHGKPQYRDKGKQYGKAQRDFVEHQHIVNIFISSEIVHAQTDVQKQSQHHDGIQQPSDRQYFRDQRYNSQG
jgi:hypothetical protein